MRKRKRVDVSGAMAIADAAAQFEWTWGTADAARFAEQVGWTAPVSGYPGYDLTMRISPEDEHVAVARPDPVTDVLDCVLVDVSRYGKNPNRSALLDAFDAFDAALRSAFGAPTELTPDALHPRWELPRVTLGLSFSSGGLLLRLDRPIEREPASRHSTFERQTLGRTDWSPFLAAMPLLLEADPGDWSHAAVTRVVETAGWPVEARILSQHRGSRRNQAIVEAESESDRTLISLRAEGTLHLPDARRFGFGDFGRLVLTQHLHSSAGEASYPAALTECVRLLGIPTLVGGPGPWATWRGPKVTATLSREFIMGHPHLTLATTPTEPHDVRLHWEQEQQQERRQQYGDSHHDWDPEYSWSVAPSDADGESPESAAEARFPATKARTWARLDELLYPLFASLAADMPVLQPFANTVVWMIGRRKDPRSRIVQGWFGPAGCGVEVLDEAGEWQVTEFESTAESGMRIARATSAALRASGVKRPRKLRCEAWSLLAPQELRAFETGLVSGK